MLNLEKNRELLNRISEKRVQSIYQEIKNAQSIERVENIVLNIVWPPKDSKHKMILRELLKTHLESCRNSTKEMTFEWRKFQRALTLIPK